MMRHGRPCCSRLSGCPAAAMRPYAGSLHDAPVNDLSGWPGCTRTRNIRCCCVDSTDAQWTPCGCERLKSLRLRRPGREASLVAQEHAVWSSLVPQRVRCYVIDAELAGGMRYLLEEDTREASARLLRDDTGERVASGRMIDETWIFSGSCSW